VLVSIVIPVYKGAHTIGPLVESLFNEFNQHKIEIVLVNDGSPDDSGKVCRRLLQSHPGRIKLVELSRNFGEHNAVMAGLKHARGDCAVIMDDDFQNPPSEVQRLLDALEQDYDVVYGVYEQKHHNLFRNLGSWFNGLAANILIKKPKDLYLSSFKVMKRFVIDQIVLYDLPYPYIDGLIFRVTARIGKVTVKHRPRAKGRSTYTLSKLVGLWLNMFTNFSVLPLRVATVLGLITMFFGVGLASLATYWAYTDPLAPKGWPTLVCALVIFSGVQLIALGVIGEYLGRLFLGHNRTPQYIVREVLEKDTNDLSTTESKGP
jgi:undecaprenyl-phosphate 4-deoxy-4-formamido-L-arabinose transferase